MSLKYLLTNDLLFKCATDLPPGACNIQLLGMVCFVDQNNQLSNHRAYLESHGAKFVFLKFMLDMSIKMHGGQDAIRLEFKHGVLQSTFVLLTCRKIACYNCLPVSWPEIHYSHQPFNCLIQFESKIMEIISISYYVISYQEP